MPYWSAKDSKFASASQTALVSKQYYKRGVRQAWSTAKWTQASRLCASACVRSLKRICVRGLTNKRLLARAFACVRVRACACERAFASGRRRSRAQAGMRVRVRAFEGHPRNTRGSAVAQRVSVTRTNFPVGLKGSAKLLLPIRLKLLH